MFLQQYKCSQCSSNGVAQGQPYKNRENVKVVPKVLYFYGTHTEYRSVWKYKQQCIKKWSWVSTLWYTYYGIHKII